ncbi:MAG TPA: hypothetical protein VLV31_09450 [Candidatus Acidoferrales bacterium]|nr:hypothetical protein [Candidatus Acidoferrales bacterium]
MVRLRVRRQEDRGKTHDVVQDNDIQQESNSSAYHQEKHDSKQSKTELVQNSEMTQHQPRVSEGREARLQLYRRDGVRRFAAWLLAGHDEVQPTRNPETGEYDYSKLGFNRSDFEPLLNELNSHEVLQKYPIDTTPTCSKCGHSRFHLVYLCPFSQHSTLERGIMIEHFRCGHTDFEINFRSGNELICPKCRLMLKVIGTDYRKIERSFQCIGCGKKFPTPKIQFQCAHCGWSNYENDLVMQPIYGYKLNGAFRSELLAHCSLEMKIVEVLKLFGFQVAAPALVNGLSGTEYYFDIVGTKNKTQIMFDLISTITGEIAPRDISAFFAKVFDAKPPRVYLVATPRVSKESERLCEMYGIEVIAAEDPSMICKDLEDKLAQLTGTSPIVPDKNISAPRSAPSSGPLEISQNEMPGGKDQRVEKVETKSFDGALLIDDSREPHQIMRKARAELSRLMDEAEQRLSK